MEFGDKYSISSFKSNLLTQKKYVLFFTIILLLGSFSLMTSNNIGNLGMKIVFVFLMLIIGGVLLTFSLSDFSHEKLHITAFVVILIFGLVCAFVLPICEPSDCNEHFIRADITSRGILFPEYTGDDFSSYYVKDDGSIQWNGQGFEATASVVNLCQDRFSTVFESSHDTDTIDNSLIVVNHGFQQNPFYSYIPQAIGIFIAKLFNLNAIWLLWLGRIFNVLFYAGVVSLAVKKTPILKVPLLVTACLPLAMFQGFSISNDSFFIAVSLLIIAYFLYFYKSKEKSIGFKDVGIFVFLCLLVGLCKLPYLALCLLLFAVPFDKYENKNVLLSGVAGLVIIGLAGFAWSSFATDALWHSQRAIRFINLNVNATQQLSFIFSDPNNFVIIPNIMNSLNWFFTNPFLVDYIPSLDDYASPSGFISLMALLYMVFVYFAYPIEYKSSKKSKIIALLTVGLIYFAVCFVQILTWQGHGDLTVGGVHIRYFLPLLALVPFIFGINIFGKKDIALDGIDVNLDYVILTLMMVFMALTPIAMIFVSY